MAMDCIYVEKLIKQGGELNDRTKNNERKNGRSKKGGR